MPTVTVQLQVRKAMVFQIEATMYKLYIIHILLSLYAYCYAMLLLSTRDCWITVNVAYLMSGDSEKLEISIGMPCQCRTSRTQTLPRPLAKDGL